MGIILGAIGIFLGLALLAQIGIKHLIAAMVAGGIGFSLGDLASTGWGVYGAILGGLIGIAAVSQ